MKIQINESADALTHTHTHGISNKLKTINNGYISLLIRRF